MILARPKTKIGRRDHGRKMSLKAFEFAQAEEGWLYELGRGYIVVSDPDLLGPTPRQVRLD